MSKYLIDSSYLNAINTERKAYFLGFFFADGCMLDDYQANITLNEKDGYILQEFTKDFSYNRPLESKKGKLSIIRGKTYVTRPQKVFRFFRRELNERLKSFGLCPNKSFVIRVPFEAVDDSLMPHFIRGYFDGDGSVNVAKNTNSAYIMSNLNFCKDIQGFLKRNGIYSVIRPKGTIYRLYITRILDFKRFYDLIYTDASILLHRKKETFDKLIKNYDWNIHRPIKTKYNSYRGVTFDKRRNKWQTSKKIKGKVKFLGYFSTAEEAKKVFDKYESHMGETLLL